MSVYRYAESFDADLFRSPPSVYRGAPFWAWNTRLDREQMLRQIDIFKSMGFGGFHIHVRTGLQTEYLGDEFMDHVRACVEYARQQGLLVWLYDEDRWPSGYGGGRVTRDERFRARHLLFTTQPYDGTLGQPVLISRADGARLGNGVLVAKYAIRLEHGYLASYKLYDDAETASPEETVWYAYLETAAPSPWFNNQTYVDTLNREATQRFIEVTHEVYAGAVGCDFGTLIPSIFTDEPQFVHKLSLRYSDRQDDVIIPFTTDFFETYCQAYGEDLKPVLPELFWELPDNRVSQARYRYHDHLAERFASSYADPLGEWCTRHHLALAGHMLHEPTLHSQTISSGEVMRSYRAFGIPGIDMLCDRHEYNTAKQAQSAARQYGRHGTLSEIYGVTNWDFDFAGHKAAGDWQAALGVIVRVHHLAWMSMEGEAKRDYPASIHYQSPWHLEYPLIENHFARLNSVLTVGKPLVRVGVVHPIESYWLCFGPLDKTSLERQQRDQAFQDLTEWLLFGLIDFDFIAESLLPSLHEETEAPSFVVGAAHYEVIIVPGMRTIRASTLERLQRFHERGGNVIFAGEVPSLVDALPSERTLTFARQCHHVEFSQSAVLRALEPYRDLAIHNQDGNVADSILYQIRQQNDIRYLFLCNIDKTKPRHEAQVTLRGSWQVTMLDTFTGESQNLQAQVAAGSTRFIHDFEACGSLLLSLSPARESIGHAYQPSQFHEIGRLNDPARITLSEPNVLLLDRAAWKLDEEPWQPEEEILRLDNRLRRCLGYPLRMEAWAQPWVEPPTTPPLRRVQLRYRITSKIDVVDVSLALEHFSETQITFDNQAISAHANGYFADECIGVVPLPDFKAGEHVLVLSIPYDTHTQLEACYLLGDFGVTVRGKHAAICEPVTHLAFGDWTRQGLPFYGGNVTYHCEIPVLEIAEVAVQIPKFHAPLIAIKSSDTHLSPIAFPPYQTLVTLRADQPTPIDLIVYGSRINTFGALHNADETTTWFGPMAWRTEDEAWCDEYQLKPCGIFTSPRLLTSMTE